MIYWNDATDKGPQFQLYHRQFLRTDLSSVVFATIVINILRTGKPIIYYYVHEAMKTGIVPVSLDFSSSASPKTILFSYILLPDYIRAIKHKSMSKTYNLILVGRPLFHQC